MDTLTPKTLSRPGPEPQCKVYIPSSFIPYIAFFGCTVYITTGYRKQGLTSIHLYVYYKHEYG